MTNSGGSTPGGRPAIGRARAPAGVIAAVAVRPSQT